MQYQKQTVNQPKKPSKQTKKPTMYLHLHLYTFTDTSISVCLYLLVPFSSKCLLLVSLFLEVEALWKPLNGTRRATGTGSLAQKMS